MMPDWAPSTWVAKYTIGVATMPRSITSTPAACRPSASAASQFRAGQAAVAADHDSALALGQRGAAEGLADLARDRRVERLADDAANVIGLENAGSQSEGFGHGKLKE